MEDSSVPLELAGPEESFAHPFEIRRAIFSYKYSKPSTFLGGGEEGFREI